MNFSIRLKLIVFTSFVVILVGGSIFLYSVYLRQQRTLMTITAQDREKAAIISDMIVNDLYFLDLHSLRLRLATARVNPDIVYTYVIDKDGAVLTDGTEENPLRDQKLTDDFSQLMLRSATWVSRVEEETVKIGGPVLTPDGSRIGYLQVGFSLGPFHLVVRETTRASIYVTMISLGVGLLLAFIFATRFTRPILSIVRASEEIGGGKLDTRVPVKRGDELGTLAHSINRMAEALQRRQKETEQRAQEQAALSTVAMATSQSLGLEEILRIALDKILEVTGRERGYIRLKDPTTGQVSLAAHRGISEDYIETLLHSRTAGGKTDQVFETGEPLIINDPQGSVLKQETQREGISSIAWIPLKARGNVVGVLNVSTARPIPFSPQEVALLQAIGNVIGVALENARLFDETKRNLEGIRALHEIDMAITSTLDLRDVLKVLLDKIDLFLPYSTATVRLFNKESGLLEPVACRNLDETEWKVTAWRPGRGPANAVFESRAPLVIRNCLDDPRVKDPEFFRKYELVSYLGVPMFAREEILGVLSFYTNEEHEFTNEEVEFLSALASQAAIAIHNSEVYEEMATLASNLSRSNRVKDEFLSVMSHELRTPLNVVMGYTGMIKDRLLGEINPEQEKALEKVISRARDQLSMISSILQATQLEAEGVKAEPHEVKLEEFLDDLKLNYALASGKELNIVWDYPPDLPAINTDSEKLKHVLQNLINNAIKFTEKGTVTISARFLPISDSPAPSVSDSPTHRFGETENRGNGVVQFQVADTGIGIPKEHQSVIFERFRQVDSSETRKYGGVGIGLYIAKQFTELLGGKIEVESEPGKGSIFTVTVPRELPTT